MFNQILISTPVFINVLACLLLAGVFYKFHPRKYDTLLIFFVGTFVGLIVSYFIKQEIGVGTGFGLFAIFSLMHFRENYNTYTMVYIFIAMSLGILASLSGDEGLGMYLGYTVVALLVLAGYEGLIKGTKKISYTVKREDFEHLEATAEQDLNATIKDITIAKVTDDKITATVSYVGRR